MRGGGIAEVYLRYRLRLDYEFRNSLRADVRQSHENTRVNGKQDQMTGGFATFPGGFGRF
jgi:hypothetical protein